MKLINRAWTVIRKTGWILLLFVAASTWLEQILTQALEKEISSMEGLSPWVWFFGAASVILSLAGPVVISVLVLVALRPASGLSTMQSLNQVAKESLRASGQALSWALLFIIPGLIRFLQFAFVPFIVMQDADYNLGKKDALKESRILVNKKFFSVCFVLLIFAAIIPLLMTSLDEYSVFTEHPLTAFLLSAVDALFSIQCVLILLNIWEKSHGTYVQLETN